MDPVARKLAALGLLSLAACADRRASAPSTPSDAGGTTYVACSAALTDPANPCPATLAAARQSSELVLVAPCGGLDHAAPPDVFFGTVDCLYQSSDGTLVGWDRSSDIAEFCGNSAFAIYAGEIPPGCTFIDGPGWRRGND